MAASTPPRPALHNACGWSRWSGRTPTTRGWPPPSGMRSPSRPSLGGPILRPSMRRWPKPSWRSGCPGGRSGRWRRCLRGSANGFRWRLPSREGPACCCSTSIILRHVSVAVPIRQLGEALQVDRLVDQATAEQKGREQHRAGVSWWRWGWAGCRVRGLPPIIRPAPRSEPSSSTAMRTISSRGSASGPRLRGSAVPLPAERAVVPGT